MRPARPTNEPSSVFGLRRRSMEGEPQMESLQEGQTVEFEFEKDKGPSGVPTFGRSETDQDT
jgi:hypothetical protein